MSAAMLIGAMLLDAAFGEPRWLWSRLPHPAVLMGRAVGWLDARLNRENGSRWGGILALLVLCVGAAALGLAIGWLPLGWLWQILLAAILLAQRSLVEHVRDVGRALRLSVFDGRVMVARIVGRDTAKMEGPEVARGAIESAAENLSDGVIAPAFWFLIAGLPGILVYKVVNTADSMIGYRTPRHEDFGWASAKLDDVLNWVPARLTALLIALPFGLLGQWNAIKTDAKKHRSPNAGWPEAAMARALGVALAGPRSYEGQKKAFPFVNAEGDRDIGPEAIEASITAMWRAWGLALFAVICAAFVAWANA